MMLRPVFVFVITLLVIISKDNVEGLFSYDLATLAWTQIFNWLSFMGVSLKGINVQLARIERIRPSYDFIIVGAGSSGSVLASRLTEHNFTVLLLEAGKTENAFSQVPLFAPLLQWSDYNWDYLTEPEDNFCKAMINHQCVYPRGRALGGSSVINYMIYTRGSKLDYDTWARQVKDPSFSYEKVLPYFKKSENVILSEKQIDRGFHGNDGLIQVSHSFTAELTDAFLKAGEYLGYKTGDYNGEDIFKFSPVQTTLREGKRHSVAKAFLATQSNRENLDILLGACVTKLRIRDTRATGVEFLHKGLIQQAYARKEVILSAGAFHSPKLLMLSGIGPRQHLKDKGIEVIKDLPVGENLQDHVAFIGLSFHTNKTVEPAADVFDPEKISEWFYKGQGPLASLGGIEALGYISTKREQEPDENNETNNGDDEEENVSSFVQINPSKLPKPTAQTEQETPKREESPDIELIFVGSGTLATDYGVFNRRLQRITDEFYYQYFKPDEGKPGWTIFPMLLHPKSRGKILLRSKNPFERPSFQPNYFAHPADKQTLIDAIKFTIKLARTPAFQAYDTKLSQVAIPHCMKHLKDIPKPVRSLEALSFNVNGGAASRSNEVANEDDFDVRNLAQQDAYWNCALEYLTITLHHQVGTCKMSSGSDTSGVVDSHFKVKGFENLRVVDTSVIPMALSAHTNAPAIMLGEKAADIIKDDYL